MSRTKRRDTIDVAKKRPDTVFYGMLFKATPTEKEKRKAHMDRKKWYKPGKKAKKYLDKGAKAKTRRQLDKVVQDPDAAPLPKDPKHHEWDYN